ncbi:MAG: hypothetical protein ABIR11_02490 [Candidatus Limnocylindrales bacterium]
MRLHRLALLVLFTTVVAAGCSMLPAQFGGHADPTVEIDVAYPAGCGEFDLSDRRCRAIVESLAGQLDVDLPMVREIRLLGDPGCGQGPNVLCTRTTSFIVRVRFVRDDGTAAEGSQFCGVGGQYSILCTETPEVRISAPTLNGYTDIPCAGEAPDGCASPVPTIDPAVAPDASPLRIATLDIPLDHVGHYEIPVGMAVLPNGVLTEGSFGLANPHQDGFILLSEGAMSLVVAGPDGQPIWNVYEQGWREGTETVDVTLVFDVESTEPGRVLQVRDVVVR